MYSYSLHNKKWELKKKLCAAQKKIPFSFTAEADIFVSSRSWGMKSKVFEKSIVPILPRLSSESAMPWQPVITRLSRPPFTWDSWIVVMSYSRGRYGIVASRPSLRISPEALSGPTDLIYRSLLAFS
jgi:hypothetical protein